MKVNDSTKSTTNNACDVEFIWDVDTWLDLNVNPCYNYTFTFNGVESPCTCTIEKLTTSLGQQGGPKIDHAYLFENLVFNNVNQVVPLGLTKVDVQDIDVNNVPGTDNSYDFIATNEYDG